MQNQQLMQPAYEKEDGQQRADIEPPRGVMLEPRAAIMDHLAKSLPAPGLFFIYFKSSIIDSDAALKDSSCQKSFQGIHLCFIGMQDEQTAHQRMNLYSANESEPMQCFS